MYAVDLPDWAVARGAALNSFPVVGPAATALVVVDMQNAFVAQGEVYANPHARDITATVNGRAAA